MGASLGAFCVARAADWAQASGTVFARGRGGVWGAARAGLLLAAVFPLLCCGVHTALHCTESAGRLTRREANGTGNKEKLFFKPNRRFADGGRKTAK